MSYTEWIAAYEARTPHLLGQCLIAAEEMAAAFPELTVVKGHVYCDWGKRGHAWLMGEQGEILDPTAKQFGAIFEYEPWSPGDEARVGKCMNCGSEIWKAIYTLDEDHTQSICSEACELSFGAYLGAEAAK